MAKSATKAAPALEPAPSIRVKVTMGSNGRIVIPAEVREALGLKDGDTFVLHADPTEIVLKTSDMAIRSIQRVFAGKIPPGYSVVDEFIREKRAEAERE